ncbi:MAG TPA: ParB/RepB/Spo0J family partition protein [Vicinamibacterales bacterium]|nr:ParB/RepB/Spo0J family partition protein [Vicinamibacterales bacterium]
MTAPAAARELRTIALEAIDRPELDARIDRDPEKLEELARDLLRRGLIQPIHVFAKGDRFEVVDGFRRYLASRSAGIATIEAFVYPTKDLALEGVKYAANMFREDMSVVEEAVMFHELFTHECAQDIERLCALVGKRFEYVSDRLNLLNGDELVLDALKARKIGLGVAKELNLIPDGEYRRYYLTHAVNGGATQPVVRGWRQQWEATIGNVPQVAAPATSAPASIALAPQHDPMRCSVCGKSDREIPQILYVHQSCRDRVLEPLLEAYRGGSS